MFRIKIIAAAIGIIRSFLIEKIPYDPLKNFLEENLDPVKKIADLLTDKDPDNRRQMEEFWLANKSKFEKSSIAAAKNAIQQSVKDPVIREMLLAALDELDENTGQRKAYAPMLRSSLPEA